MSLLAIIGILLIGLALIGVEIIFIPGTTVVGIMGFFVVLLGLYFIFEQYGIGAGSISSVLIIAIVGATFYWAIQKKVWKRYSLQTEITGKVDQNLTQDLVLMQVGTTVSALRPSGMADFQDTRVEVCTTGSFVDAGVKVKIIDIQKKRITVDVC